MPSIRAPNSLRAEKCKFRGNKLCTGNTIVHKRHSQMVFVNAPIRSKTPSKKLPITAILEIFDVGICGFRYFPIVNEFLHLHSCGF